MRLLGMMGVAFLGMSAAVGGVWVWNLKSVSSRDALILPAIVSLCFVSFLYFLYLGLLAELIHDAGGGDDNAFARAVAETV